jgi:hypothetical protein
MSGATPRALFPSAVLAAFALAALPGRVRADLAPASPFLPPNVVAQGGAAGPAGPIELRGIMATSDGVQFCIYDSATKKDTWVGLNEPGHAFVVRTADPSQDRASVEYQGRVLHLDLHAAKVSSSGAATNLQSGPAVVTSQILSTSPAEEQKRLDAVAQEVRRRRMERERAMQTAPGGAAPATPPSQ